jgi:hypothetical protein
MRCAIGAGMLADNLGAYQVLRKAIAAVFVVGSAVIDALLPAGPAPR